MKSQLARTLEQRDRGARAQRLQRGELTAALNALELDWRTSAAPGPRATPDPRASAPTNRTAGAGGLGSARLTRGEAQLGIELSSGLPALPRGVHTGWPLTSYRVTSESKQPKGATAELELDVGWINFSAAGATRLMSWNGREYRDVTGAYDAKRGLLRGRVPLDEFLIVVRTPLCYGRFVPVERP